MTLIKSNEGTEKYLNMNDLIMKNELLIQNLIFVHFWIFLFIKILEIKL